MDGDDVHIREHALPGIGRRFDLEVGDDLTLSVVARRDGSRDVAVTEKGEDAPRRSVHLRREQAVAVGSILLGARFSIEHEDLAGAEVDVTTVLLGDRSPAIGKLPRDVVLPDGAEGVVVAVARDDTAQLLEDDQHRPCKPGDRLVIAARRDRLEMVVRHLAG